MFLEKESQMSRIGRLCLIVVGAVALGNVTAVGSASAEEFVASKAGEPITGKALNTQIFEAKSGGAKVECKEAKPAGTVKNPKTTEAEVNVKYESCMLFGIGSATVTVAEYTFFTESGAQLRGVSILRKNISITTAFPTCKIEVSFGQTFNKPGEVEYSNGLGVIDVTFKLAKILSEVTESGSSSLCGTVGDKNTTGTLTGTIDLGEQNGSLEVR